MVISCFSLILEYALIFLNSYRKEEEKVDTWMLPVLSV